MAIDLLHNGLICSFILRFMIVEDVTSNWVFCYIPTLWNCDKGGWLGGQLRVVTEIKSDILLK